METRPLEPLTFDLVVINERACRSTLAPLTTTAGGAQLESGEPCKLVIATGHDVDGLGAQMSATIELPASARVRVGDHLIVATDVCARTTPSAATVERYGVAPAQPACAQPPAPSKWRALAEDVAVATVALLVYGLVTVGFLLWLTTGAH